MTFAQVNEYQWVVDFLSSVKYHWVDIVTSSSGAAVLTAIGSVVTGNREKLFKRSTAAFVVMALLVAPLLSYRDVHERSEKLEEKVQGLTQDVKDWKEAAEAAQREAVEAKKHADSAREDAVNASIAAVAAQNAAELARHAADEAVEDRTLAEQQVEDIRSTERVTAAAYQVATQQYLAAQQKAQIATNRANTYSIQLEELRATNLRNQVNDPTRADEAAAVRVTFPSCQGNNCGSEAVLSDAVDKSACSVGTPPRTRPTVRVSKLPVYTPEASRLRVEGAVSACIRVSSTGTVTVTRFIRTLGYGLEEEAKKAMESMSFTPARDSSDTPVEWNGIATAEFHLTS